MFYDAMFIFFRKHYGGMSLLLRLPIKTAIFIKASCSLVRTLCYSIRKYLGFNSFYTTSFPHYVFLGGQEMTDQCRHIAMEKGLSAEYYTGDKIGRASCRERVEISAGVVSRNKRDDERQQLRAAVV